MRILVDCAYLLAAVAISPMVVYRMLRQNRYRTGWAQRLGLINRKYPAKECIWLHAVSVGEVNATKTIVQELKKRFPDFEIVISTTTDTGFARATTLYGTDLQVFYFPLDFSWIMRRAFRNIRPAICLLMELEVWPNLISIAQQMNIPVVVVNGRITERSLSRYSQIKPIAKSIFRKVTLILAQTDEYARRFVRIGTPAENVIVTGSLKYDTAQITDTVEGADSLAAQLNIDKNDTLWIAGGTGPGEEKIVLGVFQNLKRHEKFSDLRLVIVPRKPERFDEVAQLITDAGFDFVRYSEIKNTDAARTDKVPVILGDTMGDLRKFYSLATVVFVGRSLVPMGGSDMIEVAALAKTTIFGPHTFNFTQTVDALSAGEGAVLVKDKDDLLRATHKCLSDVDFTKKIAQNAQEIIRKNQGATQKTIDQITKYLNTA
ncbi:MAG: 3-deoxy-D-manno-octulosonic acid transferase [Planctomycetota bacterium]|jgi:3-deoxy-D-manno-octulosonic-acid transferase